MCRIKIRNYQLQINLIMKLKLEFTEKERHILYRLLAVVLSITFMATGIYAISYFEKLGLIQGQWQIVPAIGLHILQWWLVMRVVFKHYR
jgi:hypothetical protein